MNWRAWAFSVNNTDNTDAKNVSISFLHNRLYKRSCGTWLCLCVWNRMPWHQLLHSRYTHTHTHELHYQAGMHNSPSETTWYDVPSTIPYAQGIFKAAAVQFSAIRCYTIQYCANIWIWTKVKRFSFRAFRDHCLITGPDRPARIGLVYTIHSSSVNTLSWSGPLWFKLHFGNQLS